MKKKLSEQIKILLADKLSEEEERKLIHHREFEKIMRTQWNMERQDNLDHEIGRSMWKTVKQKCLRSPRKIKNTHTLYWSSAAAVALIFVFGITWMYLPGDRVNNMEDAFVEIFSKEGSAHMLPDSSQVWMYPGSSIRYSENFAHNRKVWLKGNSHFDVYKQGNELFTVYIDNASVVVKGTSFLINQEQENITKVTLFSGMVDFTAETIERTIEMKPSQELTFNSENETVKLEEIKGVKWANGNYEYANIDLLSWIEIAARIYNKQIHLEGPVTKNLLNGRIRYNESLEEAIEKLCFSIGWQYRKEEEKHIIFH